MSEGRVEETRARSDSHPVDEVLPAGRMAAFGLQHVMTTYAGIIAVPLIVASALVFRHGRFGSYDGSSTISG
jgi:uric acid transporter